MSKEISYGDHHTHAQDICFHNEESAKNFGVMVGDHLYPEVSVDECLEHVLKDNLDTVWFIYEDSHKFGAIREAITAVRPDCQVNGFYFIRDPQGIDEVQFAKLFSEGLIQGIKIHPVIDNFPLTPASLDKVMQTAERYDLPVIFHSDDRQKTMHLTSPEYQRELAVTYPRVRLVIGHGGAYAHPRLVGENNTAAVAYWKTREKLITSALTLANDFPSVFYEMSTTSNYIKAGLIAEYVEANHSIVPKIVGGSDYPTRGALLKSQIRALETAGLEKSLVIEIAKNRL
jgi:predicted TIM-barrel fold metal-dependent hydrolase